MRDTPGGSDGESTSDPDPDSAASPILATTGRPPRDVIARDIVESLLEGCQVISPEWRYLYVNEALVRQARQSRDDLVGRTMMECYPGIEETPLFEALRRCMKSRRYEYMENSFLFPDGSAGWFALRLVPVPEGVCVLSLDVTETKRAAEGLRKVEEQLRQAQKMEAVGRLAGTVAHDFNNIITVILSYTDLLLADLPPGHPMDGDLREVLTAGTRAAALTQRLLLFSRQQVLTPTSVDFNELLSGMGGMLERLVGPSVSLSVLAAKDLAKVRGDVVQLEQLVMNLVVNARDAMPSGGKLTLETKNVDLDEAYAKEHVGVTPGKHVMLSVSDTGIGMDRETRARVFNPFFTTKEPGKGTGLGLSIVFGIARQGGGHVWVYSEKGKGTTFKVFMPWTDGEPAAHVSLAPREDGLRGGSETILLVEDDDQVRAVARGILRKNGYEVVAASNPGEALLVAEQHAGTIHLLLADIVMPRLTGPELATRIRAQRPDIRVLFMSGYSDEAVVENGMLDATMAFLQKPLTVRGLTRTVREVLDAV